MKGLFKLTHQKGTNFIKMFQIMKVVIAEFIPKEMDLQTITESLKLPTYKVIVRLMFVAEYEN